MGKKVLTTEDLYAAVTVLGDRVGDLGLLGPVNVFGVPRGGVPVCYVLQNIYRGNMAVVDSAEEAHVIIDDIIDSGKTRARYRESYPLTPFMAAYENPEDWIVFPWESSPELSAQDIPTRLLQYIGEDASRSGLAETPGRFIRAWDHWSSGYGASVEDTLKVFTDGAEDCDELVIVKDIPIYSHCEHHLAPFFGVAHIGYIPDGKIVGLSKLSRVADIFARRLQVQERLTNQIADALQDNLNPLGVAVVINCRHMCMESRGVQRQGSSTITSAMRGVLRTDGVARSEFLRLIG